MQITQKQYSPEEYLNQEAKAEFKSEYIEGEIIPMAGGTPNHNQIALNFSGFLNIALRRQNYRVFMTDMRLWIPEKNIYTYPDVMVVARPLEYALGRQDTITNALLIAEVLSDSTGTYDSLDKFKFYRTMPTFQEYLLISQTEIHVEQFFKTENNQWILSEYGSNAVLSLKTINLQILINELYENVEFVNKNL